MISQGKRATRRTSGISPAAGADETRRGRRVKKDPAGSSPLAEVLERVTDGFVALDRNWNLTYINPVAAAIFERKPAQLLGRHFWSEFPERMGQPFHLACERAMKTLKPVVLEEHDARRDRWFENRIYPSPDGLTVYFHEITDRKLAKDQLIRLLQQRETFARRLLEDLEAERTSLSRELHDGPLQQISAGRAYLQAYRMKQETKPGSGQAFYEKAVDQFTSAVEGMHRTILNLRPPDLDHLGLCGALRRHVRTYGLRTGWNATFETNMADLRLAHEAETALFRIAQEAITNAEKHSGSGTLAVRVRADRRALLLEVRDKGHGFTPAPSGSTEGIGLSGMLERADIIGATLRIQSGPRRGTCVRVKVPLAQHLRPTAHTWATTED